MSGGSYNYLCERFPEDLLHFQGGDDLTRMIARLKEIRGGEDAAADAERLRSVIIQAHVDVTRWLDRLKPVFKAVEWRDSSDWGEDQMLEYVQAYRSEEPPPRHMILSINQGEP